MPIVITLLRNVGTAHQGWLCLIPVGYSVIELKVHNKEPSDVYCMWYLYFAILLAVVCLGIPLYLVYRTDKRRKRAFDKRNKNTDDMNDLDHY